MELNPRQLSSLNEMGIPVWEFRTNEASQANTIIEEAIIPEPNEQLLNSEWVVVIDGQNYDEQAQGLLRAMLRAINVDQQNLAIIDSAQLVQLQHSPSQCRVMIVLGEEIANGSLGKAIIRGSVHKTLNQQITTVVSLSLSELLEKPENKALAWQDLQLAKRTYLPS